MKRLASALMLTLVVACSSAPTPTPTAAPRPEPVTPPGQPSAVPPRADAPLTLDGYKLDVARRIARVSPETYDEAPPEVLKSIVVLEVTIDRNGSLERVVVRRSNGFRALENLAMDSVRRAAPFEVPVVSQRHRDGSVTFLESFLFRDDNRFRLLSLVR
jgi:TonB family protein